MKSCTLVIFLRFLTIINSNPDPNILNKDNLSEDTKLKEDLSNLETIIRKVVAEMEIEPYSIITKEKYKLLISKILFGNEYEESLKQENANSKLIDFVTKKVPNKFITDDLEKYLTAKNLSKAIRKFLLSDKKSDL